MSLRSSLLGFLKVWREDRAFARLGPGSGRLLGMHYRGRLEARCSWTPRMETLRIEHFSRTIELTLSAPYLGAMQGVFLDLEYDCSGLFETPPRRILDLGANIGMGALTLSCQFPEAEFLCVEPDPRNLDLLKANLDRNGVESKIVPAAVGSAAGTLRLRFDADPTCSALETSPMHDLAHSTEVKVMTVPDLLRERGWDRVDLMKIDIEGTEDPLLLEENEWLEKVNAIILEIHPNTTPERIANGLSGFGFSLRRHGHGREPVYLATR